MSETTQQRTQRCLSKVNGKQCERSAAPGKGTRGLCRPCYTSAVRRVNSGETTWEELERLKLVLPPTTRKSMWNEMADKALAEDSKK